MPKLELGIYLKVLTEKIIYGGSFFLIMCFCVFPSKAQNIDRIFQQQDNIISREEQHQKILQEQFREHSPPQDQEIEEPSKKPQHLEKTFKFKEIILEGANLLDEEEKKELTKDFTNRILCLSEINDLLRKITNYYIEKGYVTARAYLVPQDLTSGILKIVILEGNIESIKIKHNGEVLEGKCHVIPTDKNEVLNLRHLEQGIDQITRLKSYDAKIDLEPGEKDGGMYVVINTTQDRPFFINAFTDNYGLKSTGEKQFEVQGVYDDLLGLYDSWGVDYRRNLDLDNFDLYSKNLSFQGSVPVGYWTVRYFGSLFKYLSTVKGQFQSFHFSGNNQTHRGEIEHILHRNGKGKTGIAPFLAYKDFNNFVENVLLKVGSPRLSMAGARLFHVRRFWEGVLSSAFTYTQGMQLFGALKNKETAPKSPKPQFSRYSVDLSYFKPFKLSEEEFVFYTLTSAQYSPQNLFSSERISFGGAQTVRGYQDTNLSGNTGLYIRNDLAWTVLDPKEQVVKRLLGKVQSFVGYDYGWIRKDNSNPFERGFLESICLGFRLEGGLAAGEIAIAKSLARPSFLKKEGTVFHIRFGINY